MRVPRTGLAYGVDANLVGPHGCAEVVLSRELPLVVELVRRRAVVRALEKEPGGPTEQAPADPNGEVLCCVVKNKNAIVLFQCVTKIHLIVSLFPPSKGLHSSRI